MSGRKDDDGKSQWSTRAQGGGYEEEEGEGGTQLETSRFTKTIEGAEKRVLSKSGTSTMNRARQMFLLDQLKKPTPNPEGQDGPRMSRSDSFGSVESASRFAKGQGSRSVQSASKPKAKPKPKQAAGGHKSQSKHQNTRKTGSGRKSRVKSRTQGSRGRPHGSRSEETNELRGSVGRLTKTNRAVSSALGQQFLHRIREMGMNTFWTLSGLVRDKSVNENVGLHLSVKWVRDLSQIVKSLHSENDFHGSINAERILLDRNLKVYLESPGGVRMMNFSSDVVRNEFMEKRKLADILALGIALLEVIVGREISTHFCSNLFSVREHFLTMVKQPQKKMDELSSQIVEEINEAFEDTEASVEVKEFCIRTVTRHDHTRMTAEDAYAWLSGLVDRIEAVPPKDSVPHVLRILLISDHLPRKKGPALIHTKEEAPKPRKTLVKNVKKKPHKSGYMSDESHYVPGKQEEKPQKKIKTRNAKNRLSMFLQETYQQRLEEEMVRSQQEQKAKEEAGARERSRSQDKDYRRVLATLHKDLDMEEVLKEIKWSGKERKAIEQMKKVQELDPEDIAKRFERQERLSVNMVSALIAQADKSLREEPNNVQLRGGAIIVGDIHGQFFDLRNLFAIAGTPGTYNEDGSEKTFIFLGDYVDRGKFSCEVLFYLFALKVRYPAHVWLIRGNHESRATSGYFGFKRECQAKYGLSVFNQCCDAFQAMPLACTVTTSVGKFFCVHGGISPNVTSVHQFTEFDRFNDPDISGFLCDVLWADPVELKDDDEEENYKQALGEYYSNPLRGCSYRFGLAAVNKFLKDNDLLALVRAHQVQAEGYYFHYFQDVLGTEITSAGQLKEIDNKMPPVITVFSAPNYQGTYGNKAAILTLLNEGPSKSKNPKDTLVPLSFDAVEEPPLVKLIDEQRRQVDAIETNIPYMPTSFDDFVAKAYELEKGDNLELLQPHKDRQKSTTGDRRRSKKLVKAVDVAAKKHNFQAHSAPSFRQLKGLGDDPKEWGTVASRIQQYQKAAKLDRLSEINPLVKAKKLEEAKEKLEDMNELQKKLPSNISIEETKKRSSMRLLRAHKQNEDGKVTFTKAELQSLQALFLIVDSGEKGHLDITDLVAWSEDEESISQGEARECISILDFDGDGVIGFEDFMVFAAYIKKLWLEQMMKEQLEFIQGRKLGNQ